MDQAGILSTVHYSHATFTDLLKNLVMANGLADHESPPHAMQLRPMLRSGGAKGNGNDPKSRVCEWAVGIRGGWYGVVEKGTRYCLLRRQYQLPPSP